MMQLVGEFDDDTVSRLRLVIMRIARRLRQQGPEEIPAGQLSALSIIVQLGPVSIRTLAEMENVRQPTMTRMIDALEAAGWVKRTSDRVDRRVVLVAATSAAKRQIEQLVRERNLVLAARIARLDPSERALVVAALPALERLLEGDDLVRRPERVDDGQRAV